MVLVYIIVLRLTSHSKPSLGTEDRVPLNSGVKGLSAYVVEKCEMEIEDSSGKRRREQFAVKRPALLGDKGVKVATLIMAHGPIYYVAKHEKCALTEVIPHVSTKIAPRVVHVYHNSWTNQCVFTMELVRFRWTYL